MLFTATQIQTFKVFEFSAERGERVVVVIDDDVNTLSVPPDGGDLYGRTLHALADEFPKRARVASAGFFPLPRQSEHALLLAALVTWLDAPTRRGLPVSFLLDLYVGRNAPQGENSSLEGPAVARLIRQQFVGAEIAYMTVVGQADLKDRDEHNTPVFRKDEEIASKNGLSARLLQSLRIGEHPLEDFWSHTRKWWGTTELPTNGAIEDHHVMRHSGVDVEHDAARLPRYREILNAGLQIGIGTGSRQERLPRKWLDPGSLSNLQEALKSLCGSTSSVEGGKRRLSVGGLAMLALMVHQRRLGRLGAFDKIEAWDQFKYIRSPVIPHQTKWIAREAAKAWYALFDELLEDRSRLGEPALEQVLITEYGSAVEFQFTWQVAELITEARDLAAHQTKGLGARTRDAFNPDPASSPDRPTNTAEKLLTLIPFLIFGNNTMGAPAAIRFSGRSLSVASTEQIG